MAEFETVEQKQLIAKRVPPGDRWSLTSGEEVYESLTDTLEEYFQKTKFNKAFYLDPIGSALYSVDRVEVEVATYLGRTATPEMSDEGAMRMRAMLSITNDLERIGDIYFQIGKAFEKKDEKKRYFTPEQREGLNRLNKAVEEAFEIMNQNLDSGYGTISLEGAKEKEREINQLRNQLKKTHHTEMKNPEYNMQRAVIYSDIFSSYEKVGDHIINVSEAVAGEI